MGIADTTDPIIFSEPILAKKDCKVMIVAAVGSEWTVKEGVPGLAGQKTKTVKLTLQITDPNVQTEHEGARPRLTFEQAFNVESHPYWDQKEGEVRKMHRGVLFSLEEALGFEPLFVTTTGQPVDPYITRNGNKVAPKIEGVQRKPNPEFIR